MLDLLNTEDTGLVGAIGETIAWQYLYSKGINAVAFGCGRPWFIGNAEIISLNQSFDRFLERPWLTKRQLDYLVSLKEKGTGRWDFVATRLKDRGRKRKTVYLIEVKVKRQGKSRRDLRGSMKGKIQEDYKNVRPLGFIPLLVVVTLLNNWQAEVTLQEHDSKSGVLTL